VHYDEDIHFSGYRRLDLFLWWLQMFGKSLPFSGDYLSYHDSTVGRQSNRQGGLVYYRKENMVNLKAKAQRFGFF
jgi:hypothetical protein